MATDLRELNRFRNRLKNLGSTSTQFANKIVDELAKKGADIARQEYAGVEGVNVYYETTSAGSSRVVAEKEGLAYIEFGTGRVGEQSNYPKQNLPKQTLTFESPKGRQQSTSGWEYYYPNIHTKRTMFKQDGWFHKFDGDKDATFITGEKAGMQMYRTGQRLVQEGKDIIKNKMKGDGNV
jgi:hypothetical protein